MTTPSPRFSIITPCFNSRAVLPRCVGSVRGQGGPAWEHLVQDGASADGTADWLGAQSGLDWRSEKDKGMYDAINRGWARAGGEVLSWLNADEQYLPGTLARVDEVFRAHPQADVVHGDTIIVGPEGDPLAARREIPLRAAYVRNGFLYALSCSVFFHRRLWDEGLLRFDEGFRNAGDADLMLRLMSRGRRFVQVRAYLGLFGVDGNNISITPSSRMEAEGAQLRERYGALRSPALRRLVVAGRHLERLLAGCYADDVLSYDFALDEKPAYRRIENARTGARFTYESALRKIKATN